MRVLFGRGAVMQRSAYLLVAAAALLALIAIPAAHASDGEGGSEGSIEDKFRSAIGGWITAFQDNLDWLSAAMLDLIKNVIKAAYFVVGLAGFLMWSTGISRYSGKRLIMGAVLMALVSEVLL